MCSTPEPEDTPTPPAAPSGRWTGRERLAFLAILLLLGTIVALHLRERLEAERVRATEEVLDALMARIEAAERDHRHALGRPPATRQEWISVSDREDAWGRPLRVDGERRIVYSLGPDGQDDHGEGDDIVRFFGRAAEEGGEGP